MKAAATVSVSALLIGIAVGWYVGRVNANQELRSIALAHELEITGLCANSLTLQQRQDSGRLVTLLERRLDNAVGYSMRLVDEGARLYPASPNLRESARRAAEHYAAVNNMTKRQAAEALLARLSSAR